MNRGDVVLVAGKGAYSRKPRPALVVQSDLFNGTHASVSLCLITSELHDAPLFRLTVLPDETNGLRQPSQIMIDKLFSAPTSGLPRRIGSISPALMQEVDAALRVWLDL